MQHSLADNGPNSAAYSVFLGAGTREAFLIISSPAGTGIVEAADHILRKLECALEEIGSQHLHTVFSRLYFSEVEKDWPTFQGTDLYTKLSHAAVSPVGQAPVEGGCLSLLCYQVVSSRSGIERGLVKTGNSDSAAGFRLHGNYRTMWLCDINNNKDNDPVDGKNVEFQAHRIFERIEKSLDSEGMRWSRQVLRTWIFISSIDENYAGLIKARQEFFETQGLSAGARYPASTGIGSEIPGPGKLIRLDALAVSGLSEQQVESLNAPDWMPAAMTYGVAFERGIKIIYGDRIHYHISGTASIDAVGQILYPGDAGAQTNRALQNLAALLGADGSNLGHLAYLIAYVRNVSEAGDVRSMLKNTLPPTVPIIIVRGAVCRPGWLVEIEGLAIRACDSGFKNFP